MKMREETAAGNIKAATQFLVTPKEKYAYRRFGQGPGLPLLFLQHLAGTLGTSGIEQVLLYFVKLLD